MALMLGKLHDALIAANVPPDKAREAAEEVAGFENRLANIETKLSVLTWMAGTNIVITLGILWKLMASQ
jgi:hypothetical protein